MTPKRKRFAQEYLIDCNATQAAIRAGYSARAAHVTGSRLLSNANVSKVLTKLMQKRDKVMELTAQEVIEGLRSEAHAKGEGTSHSARVAAWGHLAKAAGITGKHDHNVKSEIVVRAWSEELDG